MFGKKIIESKEYLELKQDYELLRIEFKSLKMDFEMAVSKFKLKYNIKSWDKPKKTETPEDLKSSMFLPE